MTEQMSTKFKVIEVGIGLADSSFISYNRDWDRLEVILLTWDERKLILRFFNPAYFFDNDCDHTTQLRQALSVTPLISAVIKRDYDEIKKINSYKHYQILDLNDEPALEIICEGFDTPQIVDLLPEERFLVERRFFNPS